MEYLIHNGKLETPVFELLTLVLAFTWLWILLSEPEN